ncbi:STAS domain-containing protein [Streptomyces sp900105245]|uniref:STAS domain-containing protein n=1 Tax=Streptomyces sp. 900105245 TaxID=3154379 RepID=A0ABV1ULC8_9ACTN
MVDQRMDMDTSRPVEQSLQELSRSVDIAISARTDASRAEIIVSGELDIGTAMDLRSVLRAAVIAHEEMTIDLSGLTFCDCTGVATFVSIQNLAHRRGRQMVIGAIPGHLQKVLRLTRTVLADKQSARASTTQAT